MEKALVKTWVYTFLATLAVCIVFVRTSYHVAFNGTTYIVPLRDYVFEVLRRSLAVSLLVTATAAITHGMRLFLTRRRA